LGRCLVLLRLPLFYRCGSGGGANMKFLLFGNLEYYPLGGFSDFAGSYSSLYKAMKAAKVHLFTRHWKYSEEWDWAHIVMIDKDDIIMIWHWDVETKKL
jgi:hypothetical protein